MSRVWGDSGGVLLEGSYVDATLQQINRQGRWKFGGGGPVTYVVSFPRVLNTVKCPVIGCLEAVHSVGPIREDFVLQKHFSLIAVVQEGKEPCPDVLYAACAYQWGGLSIFNVCRSATGTHRCGSRGGMSQLQANVQR